MEDCDCYDFFYQAKKYSIMFHHQKYMAMDIIIASSNAWNSVIDIRDIILLSIPSEKTKLSNETGNL